MASTINNKLMNVSDIIPENLSYDNKDFTDFLDAYIVYLEQHNDLVNYLHIIENKDIDTVSDDQFKNHLRKNIGLGIPDVYEGNMPLLYKNLSEIYSSSGTVESIKLFFSLFYDSDVDVTFPKNNLLIPSPNKSINGHLSDYNIRAQDSHYYQEHSYLVSGAKYTKDKWGFSFNKLAHPAGFTMFSDFILETIINTPLGDINHEACLEPSDYEICSFLILKILGQESLFNISVIESVVEKILLLYKIDRPFGMNGWIEKYKFKLISPCASWDKYMIKDAESYLLPGNIEAEVEIIHI